MATDRTNVVAMPGRESIPDEPVPDVVERLEELLIEAKAGRIRAVAFACTTSNRGASSGWGIDSYQAWPLGGALLNLLDRYQRYVREEL